MYIRVRTVIFFVFTTVDSSGIVQVYYVDTYRYLFLLINLNS